MNLDSLRRAIRAERDESIGVSSAGEPSAAASAQGAATCGGQLRYGCAVSHRREQGAAHLQSFVVVLEGLHLSRRADHVVAHIGFCENLVLAVHVARPRRDPRERTESRMPVEST